MNRYAHLHTQRGIAIVEFTIVLPLLIFLLFATAEVGRLLFQYNTLTKATEDGARYLAGQVRTAQANGNLTTITSNAAALIQHGTIQSNQPTLLPGTVTVTTSTTQPAPNPIRVTASYTYVPMALPSRIPGFGLWPDFNLTIPLTAQVEMPIL